MKVIVLVAQGWGANWLGCYGNEWIDTRYLDQLASESVVFDQHFSNLPHHEGFQHTVRTGSPFPHNPTAENPNLFEEILQSGVRTVFINDAGGSASVTKSPGWDRIIVPDRLAADSPGEALILAVQKTLKKLAKEDNWVLWIETDRLLPPWIVPLDVYSEYARLSGGFTENPELTLKKVGEEDEDEDELEEADGFLEASDELESSETATKSDSQKEDSQEDDFWDEDEDETPETAEPVVIPPLEEPTPGNLESGKDAEFLRLQNSFGAVVTLFDAELGAIFDLLREHELDETATWVVTSSFGYPLGERRQVGMLTPSVHEESTHLPLLVRLPQGAEAGRRITQLTQPPDLLPTLLDWAQKAPKTEVHGKSWLGLLKGNLSPIHSALVSYDSDEKKEQRSLRTQEWLLIEKKEEETVSVELYAKPEDRWEFNNQRQPYLEWADYLTAILQQYPISAPLLSYESWLQQSSNPKEASP